MENLNAVSKRPNYVPFVHKKFWATIFTIIEFFIDYDSYDIIEYQIYSSIFPILQGNLVKNNENCIWNTNHHIACENMPILFSTIVCCQP